MITKAQFNPSTLKASWNPATSKAQTYESAIPGFDCAYCAAGKTPKYITITFSNVIIKDGCYDTQYFNSISNINGSLLLTQEYGCYWFRRQNAYSDEHIIYEGPGCSGNIIYSCYPTYIYYEVLRQSNGTLSIYIKAGRGLTGCYVNLFRATPEIAVGNCCTVSNIANDYTEPSGYNRGAYGGTVTIQEGNRL